MNNRRKKQTTATTGGWSPLSFAVVVFATLAVLLVYGFALWLYRYDMNVDRAIVRGLVGDILHGGARPAMLPGQPAMGTLEAYVNAFSFLCLGRSAPAFQLGTLLFVLASLLPVARMAHRTGGPWGVAAALTFCAFAPVGFLHCATSPQGGYGLLVLCTAALLDLGALLVIDARAQSPRRGRPYSMPLVFALALLAGIGFWNTGLILPAIGAVAITILVLAPHLLGRPLFWCAGLVGFLVGSIPLWLAKLGNGVEALGGGLAAMTSDGLPAARHAAMLFLYHGPALFDVLQAPPFLHALVLLAALFPVMAASTLLTSPRQRAERESLPDGLKVQLSLLFAYLGLVLLAALCTTIAPKDTPRHLLPAIPVLAVFFGIACTMKGPSFLRRSSIIALAVLGGWQAGGLSIAPMQRRAAAARYEQAQRIAQFLREAGKTTAISPASYEAYDVTGDEAPVVFCDPLLARTPRFLMALERDVSPAIIGDTHGTASWAAASGGKIHGRRIEGVTIVTNAVPPSPHVREVPPAQWRFAANEEGRELTSVLTDRSLLRPVRIFDQDTLTIDLKEATPLCGIRLFAQSAPFLEGFSLYGRASADGPYHRLTPLVPETGLAWSGPRFYHYSSPFPREARFAPEELESIQIRFDTSPGTPRGELFDLQLLAPASGPRPTYEEALPALLALLRRQGVQRLYAPRWTAHRVADATHGAIRTNWDDPLATGGGPMTTIALDIFTAVLIDEAGIPSLREAFRSHGFLMREIPIPPFGALFIPESNQRIPIGPKTPTGVIYCENYALNFAEYGWIRQYLDNLRQPMDGEVLANLYRREPEAVPLLQALLSVAPDEKAAMRIWSELQALTRPDGSAAFPACFGGKITWLGSRILGDPMARDLLGRPRAIAIRSYWSAPSALAGRSFDLVYALSATGPGEKPSETRHLFPLETPSIDSLNDRHEACWHTDSFLPLPETPDDRSWSLSLSLQDKTPPFRRLRVKTDLPTRRNEVILDDAVSFPHALSF